jgi:YegS/Rv2252/BmrU family lipid kinase
MKKGALMNLPYKNVHVIINPAAGKDEPILNTINKVFHQHGIDWQVSITKKFGDATRLAKRAITDGVDLIAGYGGDGTQMEIANAVMGTDTPMAILPGGTGNAMSFELRVPRNLKPAVELICQSNRTQKIDLARIGEQYFMLRAYSGIEESEKTSRDDKDRYGNLAYILDTIRGLKNPPHAKYRLTIDDKEIELEGLTCLVLNSGSLGGIDFKATKRVSVSDGLIDVFIVKKDFPSITALASYLLDIGESRIGIYHWQGKKVHVEADPPQTTWIDGELFGPTPYTINIIPRGVSIVVPE